MILRILSKGKSSLKALMVSFLLLASMMVLPAQAEVLSMSDAELEGISAKGEISIGSYQWNDNHQFDASTNKGAIVLDGYVQQYTSAEIIVNATQSAVATDVNAIGNISASNSTISITNTNESTAFVGGF